MEKIPIEVTQSFINELWNLTGDKESPNNANIQTLRFYIYMFSISKENIPSATIPYHDVLKDAFSYIDLTGKRKYLINKSDFDKRISKPPISSFCKYDKETNLITFNFTLSPVFHRNYDKKKDNNYIKAPFRKIRPDEWNDIISSSENKMKLYFFILYYKLHGSYPYIKTSLDDIRNRCMISEKNYSRLKIKLNEILKDFKAKKIIFDYSFDTYNLKIQKYEIKPKKEKKVNSSNKKQPEKKQVTYTPRPQNTNENNEPLQVFTHSTTPWALPNE